jgi:hypothetical protein
LFLDCAQPESIAWISQEWSEFKNEFICVEQTDPIVFSQDCEIWVELFTPMDADPRENELLL